MARARDLPWAGAAQPRDLSAADFRRAAETLGCDEAAIRAVWEVEAGGRHFLPDGSVIRRFEPHHFPRHLWDRIGFSVREGERPWRASLRLSTEAMFEAAARADLDGALTASSWGAPQIMGFNARDAGYGSALEMVRAMAESAPAQLQAFCRLIIGWRLASALRAHDWRAFAARYNGSGQVEHYARLLESAYRRHSGARSPVVLRAGARGAAVAELQRALGIEDDGAFGPRTEAAVKAFQRQAGLTADGVVGHLTWTALQARVPEVAPAAQESVAEHRVDVAAQITGATAAVGAVAASVGQLREALPVEIFESMIWIAVALGVVWAAAHFGRRVLGRVR